MCFVQGDESYPVPGDSKGGLGQIGESIYVQDADEQIIREAATI